MKTLSNLSRLALAVLCLLTSSLLAIEYKYDTLGRLTKVIYDDGREIVYDYDDAGNRKTVSDSASGGASSNNPPVAVNDSASALQYRPVYIYVLNNDSDPDADSLSVTGVTGTGCSVTNNTYLTCFFPYRGTVTNHYTISDGNGGTDTGSVTISISGGGGLPF